METSGKVVGPFNRRYLEIFMSAVREAMKIMARIWTRGKRRI